MRERGIEVELTDDARELLGNLGYDPTYGARPLKRVIQKQLVDKLALRCSRASSREGDTVAVDAEDGELALHGRGDRSAPSRPRPDRQRDNVGLEHDNAAGRPSRGGSAGARVELQRPGPRGAGPGTGTACAARSCVDRPARRRFPLPSETVRRTLPRGST